MGTAWHTPFSLLQFWILCMERIEAAPKSFISSAPRPGSRQRKLNLMLLVRQCLAGCAALQADGETN